MHLLPDWAGPVAGPGAVVRAAPAARDHRATDGMAGFAGHSVGACWRYASLQLKPAPFSPGPVMSGLAAPPAAGYAVSNHSVKNSLSAARQAWL